MTDSTLPPLPKAVAWQKAIRRSDEDGDCIIGWDYCWNEYEFNALLIPKRALFTAEQITEARAPLLAEIERLKAQVAELVAKDIPKEHLSLNTRHKDCHKAADDARPN